MQSNWTEILSFLFMGFVFFIAYTSSVCLSFILSNLWMRSKCHSIDESVQARAVVSVMGNQCRLSANISRTSSLPFSISFSLLQYMKIYSSIWIKDSSVCIDPPLQTAQLPIWDFQPVLMQSQLDVSKYLSSQLWP